MDITDIHLPDHSFDVIICNHVMEHIPDDTQAMSELYRVMKPGGWAILQTPISGDTTFEDPTVQSPEERQRLFGQRDHVRIYGRDYEDRLRSVGFTVNVDGYVRSLDPVIVSSSGLDADEDIYYCARPD